MSRLPVSIVIPALNEGKALVETLHSIEAAEDLPSEIVVVDDGSSDHCCDGLRDGGHKGTVDVVLITQERRGVAGARNAGASIARQPFIVFLDAHCSIEPGWLSGLLNIIEMTVQSVAGPAIRDSREPQYVGCGATLVGRALRYRWLPVRGERPTEVGILPGGCLALRRELFDRLGGFDQMKHFGFEDVEFCFRAWRLGAVLLAVPAARIEHNFRRNQPFEAPPASFLYNAVRTALLHLTGERLRATLSELSLHPDFTKQLIELFAGDFFERKSWIDARACKDLEDYFLIFPLE